MYSNGNRAQVTDAYTYMYNLQYIENGFECIYFLYTQKKIERINSYEKKSVVSLSMMKIYSISVLVFLCLSQKEGVSSLNFRTTNSIHVRMCSSLVQQSHLKRREQSQ